MQKKKKSKASKILPYFAVVLHTVGSGNQPFWTDDGRSTHVTIGFNLEADLPGELPVFCILTSYDT